MRFTFSDGRTEKTGDFARYCLKSRFSVRSEYPLEMLICFNVWRPRTQDWNHTNLFVKLVVGLLLLNNIPQLLHLNLFFPAWQPHFITARLPQAQQRFFWHVFKYKKSYMKRLSYNFLEIQCGNGVQNFLPTIFGLYIFIYDVRCTIYDLRCTIYDL